MTLPLACAINAEYVLPLLVTLTSLQDHLAPGSRPVLYLMHRGLQDQAVAAISGVIETHLVELRPSGLTARAHRRFPPEASAALMLSELLPDDLGRVMFLDADVLVCDDVAFLWRQELGGRVLAAARDTAIPSCGSARGVKDRARYAVPDDAPYFNAGVMVIDLQAWRRHHVRRRAMDYLQQIGDRADCLHQEALNAVIWNDWLPLPARWNVLAGVAGRRFDRSGSDAGREPGIVHFGGRFKPWRMAVGGRYGRAYREVLQRVVASAPAVERTWRDVAFGLYDRRLRDWVYSGERWLWERRMF